MLQPGRERLRQVTSALIHLKTDYPTFSTEDFDFDDSNLDLKVVRLNHPNMDAVSMVNFRTTNADINPKFQSTGTWYEYFTGDSLIVTDPQEKIAFGPGEYRIYTSRRITPPDGFITATDEPLIREISMNPSLISNEESITGFIPDAHHINEISMTNLNGVMMKINYDVVAEGFRIHTQKELPAGMYVVTIRTDEEVYVGKIIKQ